MLVTLREDSNDQRLSHYWNIIIWCYTFHCRPTFEKKDGGGYSLNDAILLSPLICKKKIMNEGELSLNW